VSTALHRRPARQAGTGGGGVPARRAVSRWAWRLFRREWRQQLLVLAMLTGAVAVMIFGAGVATNTPPSSPNAATFGTARALITLPGSDPHLAADIAAVTSRFGQADVIENQAIATGVTGGTQLRAQNPDGLYGRPMLTLVSGHYPTGPGQVAPTSQVVSLYRLRAGGVWQEGGQAWHVTGIVENPSNLLDEFALVAPGQIATPTQVTILLGTANVSSSGLPAGAAVAYPSISSSGISPATVVLVVTVLGLVFIGLVAVAGFTVMAQRRLRALGMLSALGATERNVRLVMVANGAVVGIVASLIGAAAGFGAWFAYVPRLEAATAHRIDPANLPWAAVVTGMILAVATAVLAARRPARTVARIPVVAALSGRPAAPGAVHRSAAAGVAALAGGLCLLAFSGGWGANSGKDALFLLVGLLAVIFALLALAPACVGALASAGRPAPVAVRLALRDLARYRARSGAALAAVSFAVLLAGLTSIAASIRFSDVLDYTGPNLTPSQLIVYTPLHPSALAGPPTQPLTQGQLNALRSRVDGLAASLHSRYVLALDSAGRESPDSAQPTATLNQVGTLHNNFYGPLYVATPALLRQYGIHPGQIAPGTDILSMRPGLASAPRMRLIFPTIASGPPGPPGSSRCPAATCLADPKMQTFPSLPAGTSAPNTVITMHAVSALGLRLVPDGWLIQTPEPLTAAQISAARQLAVASGATIETKSGQLGLSQISDGATALGILIAFGVLAMTVGLIRSETASDLRTLTATGASGRTRRTLAGVTAGALGLLGALLGTAAAVLAGIAWARSSLSTTFGNVRAVDLIAVLIGLPLLAAIGGWLLAGREPPTITRQPLE
jgi:putative ABC transport system permease protein